MISTLFAMLLFQILSFNQNHENALRSRFIYVLKKPANIETIYNIQSITPPPVRSYFVIQVDANVLFCTSPKRFLFVSPFVFLQQFYVPIFYRLIKIRS